MVLQFELEVIFPMRAQQYLQDRFTHQFRRFLAKVVDATPRACTQHTCVTQENKALRIALIDSWEEDGKVFVKQTTSPDVAAWLPASTSCDRCLSVIHQPITTDYASYVQFYTSSIEYHDVMEFPATMTLPYTIRVRAKACVVGHTCKHAHTPFAQPAFTETVSTDNTLVIHAIDDTSCRQVLHSTITCNVVGIGSFVESYLRDSLERIYAGYAQVMAKWVKHRDALLQYGGVLLYYTAHMQQTGNPICIRSWLLRVQRATMLVCRDC